MQSECESSRRAAAQTRRGLTLAAAGRRLQQCDVACGERQHKTGSQSQNQNQSQSQRQKSVYSRIGQSSIACCSNGNHGTMYAGRARVAEGCRRRGKGPGTASTCKSIRHISSSTAGSARWEVGRGKLARPSQEQSRAWMALSDGIPAGRDRRDQSLNEHLPGQERSEAVGLGWRKDVQSNDKPRWRVCAKDAGASAGAGAGAVWRCK